MGEPLTGMQMKRALELWGGWKRVGAVQRLDDMVYLLQQELKEQKIWHVVRLTTVERQFGHRLGNVIAPIYREADMELQAFLESIQRERDRVAEFIDAVGAGIQTLSKQQQAILEAKYVRLQDDSEIASELSIDRKSVQSQRSAATNRLRKRYTRRRE